MKKIIKFVFSVISFFIYVWALAVLLFAFFMYLVFANLSDLFKKIWKMIFKRFHESQLSKEDITNNVEERDSKSKRKKRSAV